jgi:hypothetical protein
MHNLAQVQYGHLASHQSRNWISGRYLIFMLGLNAAAIPLWVSINETHAITLLVVGGIIYFANSLVILRTLRLASTNTYGTTSDNWALIALTGMKFVYNQWLGIIRFVWKDHLLFAILRFGLAIGIAEYFHFYLCLAPPGLDTIRYAASLDNALCYISSNLDLWNPPVTPPIAGIPILLIGAIIIFSFTLLEVGLCTAIGVCFSYLHLPSRRFRLALGIFTRFLVAIIALLLWSTLLGQTFALSPVIRSFSYNFYDLSQYNPELALELKQTQRIMKHSQIGVLSLADGGTFLSAQFMRPSWGLLANIVYGIPSAMIGLICYGIVIGFFLFVASRFLRQQGFVT